MIFTFVKNLSRLMMRFAHMRNLSRRLKTRADVEAWQQEALAAFLKDQSKHLGHFRPYADEPLGKWPRMDKAELMSSFGRFNRAGITTAKAWAMFDGRITPRKGLHVGGSTGTSGNRGLYVINDNERMDWLGAMLSKTLPRFPFEKARVALMLPATSPLYHLPERGPLAFRFFDLHKDMRALTSELEDFTPDTLIAPPKTLLWMAEAGLRLPLKRVFSGAEVLEAQDRARIETHFGLKVRDIYMATEGLLGVACEHGTLHLCEDVMHFEFEPVPGTDLVNPVITDFTRTTQAMIRYRMNDLLRLSDVRCACGSPFQAVAAVEGRIDDVFELTDGGGESQSVMPGVLRNTVIDADPAITDFRLQQTGPDRVILTLAPDLPSQAAARAEIALNALMDARGLKTDIEVRQAPLTTGVRKLRRVERVWRPQG